MICVIYLLLLPPSTYLLILSALADKSFVFFVPHGLIQPSEDVRLRVSAFNRQRERNSNEMHFFSFPYETKEKFTFYY